LLTLINLQGRIQKLLDFKKSVGFFGFAQGAISRWLSGAEASFPQGSQRAYYLSEITLGIVKK
jgi:hypothetical protein